MRGRGAAPRSGEEDRREAAALGADPGVFQAYHLEQLEKLVAGLASFAAFAAVGWSVLVPAGAPAPGGAPQLASAGQPASAPAAVAGRSDAGVMLRDPKLDELLAAHRQFGAASALPMPAGFVRNAAFDGPSR